MKRALLLGVAAILGARCSCGPPSIAIEDMPARAASTLCTKYYACCTAAELANISPYGPDESACESNLKGQFGAEKNAAQTSESKMRLTYHGDKLASCLDAYGKLSCTDLKQSKDSQIADCDGVFEPKVALMGACSQSNECISGSCRGASVSADGMCTAKAAESASCQDADCAKGAYCGGNKTCAALKSDGTACGANFECSTGGCNGRNPDGGIPNMGTCGEKGGPGTTCYATQGCAIGGGLPEIVLAAALMMRRRKR